MFHKLFSAVLNPGWEAFCGPNLESYPQFRRSEITFRCQEKRAQYYDALKASLSPTRTSAACSAHFSGDVTIPGCWTIIPERRRPATKPIREK